MNMMNKILTVTASALVLATSTAYAKDPLQTQQKRPAALSDKQMDRVTAGGTAIANAFGVTLGEVESSTVTQVNTEVVQGVSGTANPSRVVLAQAWNLSVAAGGFLFNSYATSHSDTFAAWSP
jgi:hypothetical protein